MGGSTKTQESKTGIPAEQKPYAEDIFSLSQKAYQATDKAPYMGPLVPRLTGQQEDVLQSQVDLGQQLLNASNPFQIGSIRAATDQVISQMLPQLQSQSIAQGAYSGDRNAVAANEVQRLALDAAIQQMLASQFQGAQLANQGVAAQQAYEQSLLDEQRQLAEEARMAPWIGLPEYNQMVFGIPNLGLSSESWKRENNFLRALEGFSTKAGQALGGAVAGAVPSP